MNSPSLVNEDLKSHIDLKGTPEMKYSEKSFQNKPKSRKVPGRALISNENRSKSNKTLTKKLKDGNFEKEFYPTENSPKLQFKKDVGFSFASHLEAKVIEKDQQDNRKINDLNNERDFSDISPKSKSSISSASLVKSDMIPSEIKEFNINLTFVKQKYKKGFSLKQDTNSFENNSNNTILDQSKKGLNSRQDYYSSDNNNNINNSNSNNNSNNNVMTDENSKDVIKTKNNNYNPTKFKAQSSLENIISETNIAVKTTKETNEAASLIQRFYRKRMALKNNSETNAMINPEIIEIAKNYLHFANPRRPCDYHIVISKDPHDVIKAILIIQTWTRKILSFKKHLLKKSNESLNEAHISVNCEESNLDSIRSVSFLDNVNEDEKNDQDMEEVVQENNERYNNVCYEKDEDEG